MKLLRFFIIFAFFSPVAYGNTLSEWVRESIMGATEDTLNKSFGLGVLIDADYKKDKELFKLIDEGQIANINYDGYRCEFIVSPNSENENAKNNLAIKFSGDQGENNRAQFYNYDPSRTRKDSKAFAGIIFDHPPKGSLKGQVRCRSTRLSDLNKDECPLQKLGAYELAFADSQRKALYGISHKEMTEYTGALGACCNDNLCIGKALLTLEERENPRPGFFQRIFNRDGSKGAQ